jgi:hypothetical protein
MLGSAGGFLKGEVERYGLMFEGEPVARERGRGEDIV